MNCDDAVNIVRVNKPVRCSNSNKMEEDWVYSMRREMQEIIPGLYLGPYSAAVRAKGDDLDKLGITHIVCVRQDIEAHLIRPNFPNQRRYLVVNLADNCITNIIRHLPQVKKFIDECLGSGGKVLVHGNLGVSRSASLVIGYVMETTGMSWDAARTFVQNKRLCVSPNDGFVEQLKEYEPIYRANQTLRNGQTSQETGKLKRKYEPDDSDKNYMDFAA